MDIPDYKAIFKKEAREYYRTKQVEYKEDLQKAINNRNTCKSEDRWWWEDEIERLKYKLKQVTWQLRDTSGKRKSSLLPKEKAKNVPLTSLLQIKKSGTRYVASCPLHTDKTPSLTIFPNNTWFCFSCREGGDTIKFIELVKGMSFIEAVNYLADNYKPY